MVILKNLELANYDVQIQALEVRLHRELFHFYTYVFQLIRTKRLFTRTSVVTTPKAFCMVIIQSSVGPRLNKHLV